MGRAQFSTRKQAFALVACGGGAELLWFYVPGQRRHRTTRRMAERRCCRPSSQLSGLFAMDLALPPSPLLCTALRRSSQGLRSPCSALRSLPLLSPGMPLAPPGYGESESIELWYSEERSRKAGHGRQSLQNPRCVATDLRCFALAESHIHRY